MDKGDCSKISRTEVFAHLPWEILDASCGFSFDMGASVSKAAYVHKEDWVEPKERKTENGVLRLVSFSREETSDAFAYVKERMANLSISGEQDTPLAYTTGVFGSLHLSEIRQQMAVKTENVFELDAFVQAFLYKLKQQRIKDMVCQVDKKTVQMLCARMQGFIATFNQSNMQKTTGMALPVAKPFTLPLEEKIDKNIRFVDDRDLYPCLLVMCGSLGGALKIEKDGTFQMVDSIGRCGRMFLGLGCLLTGAKTFDELMALAEKGNAKNVHNFMQDIKLPAEDESFYKPPSSTEKNAELMDFPVVLFGKAVGKYADEFKPEDLAQALLSAMASDIAQFAYLNALAFPTKHIFFCGNYVAHPLMQHYVTLEYYHRDIHHACMRKKNKLKHIHFLKDGGFYGALGVFLNYKLKYTDNMAELAAKAAVHLKEPNEKN